MFEVYCRFLNGSLSVICSFLSKLMSSGIWQKGEEEEGFYGFLIEDIQKEINRAARLVRI